MFFKNIFELATLLLTLNLHQLLVQNVTCAGLLLDLQPEMLSKIQQKIRVPVELVTRGQFRPQIWVAEEGEIGQDKNLGERSPPSQLTAGGQQKGVNITPANVHRLYGDEEKFTKFVENIAGVIRRETESFEDSVEIFNPATFPDGPPSSSEIDDDVDDDDEAKKRKTTQNLEEHKKSKTKLAQLVNHISTQSHVVMDNIRGGLDVLEKGLQELRQVIRSHDDGDHESAHR